jgi:hypothetical protein
MNEEKAKNSHEVVKKVKWGICEWHPGLADIHPHE